MDENGRVKDTNTPICKLRLNDVHAAHEILLIYSHTSRTTIQSNIGKLNLVVKPLLLKMINHRLPLRTV